MKVFRPSKESNRHDWFIPVDSIVCWRLGLDRSILFSLCCGDEEIIIFYDTVEERYEDLHRLLELFKENTK